MDFDSLQDEHINASHSGDKVAQSSCILTRLESSRRCTTAIWCNSHPNPHKIPNREVIRWSGAEHAKAECISWAVLGRIVCVCDSLCDLHWRVTVRALGSLSQVASTLLSSQRLCVCLCFCVCAHFFGEKYPPSILDIFTEEGGGEKTTAATTMHGAKGCLAISHDLSLTLQPQFMPSWATFPRDFS